MGEMTEAKTRLARLDAEREELARAIAVAEGDLCTGQSASWCPRCGDCTCPFEEGHGYRRDEPDGIDEWCPLHGDATTHADDEHAEVVP